MLIYSAILSLNVERKICLLFRFCKKNSLKILIGMICLISAEVIPSCREGIINPGNPVGNLNEPVVSKSDNVYTFQIDAEKVSFLRIDKTLLNITETDVYITVTDYSGGNVQLKIIGDNKQTLYQILIGANMGDKQATLINHIPESVSFLFQNFSGRFKIELSKKSFVN